MERESLSFAIGEGRDQIEFFSSFDSNNIMGSNRISINPRRFGRSGIQEIIKHHLETKHGRNYYILVDDRSMLKVDAAEFYKANTATVKGRAEFIETLANTIARSNAWCIEEPNPTITEIITY